MLCCFISCCVFLICVFCFVIEIGVIEFVILFKDLVIFLFELLLVVMLVNGVSVRFVLVNFKKLCLFMVVFCCFLFIVFISV